MSRLLLSTVALIALATPAIAPGVAVAGSETRELGAHEHGVGSLNMAMEGTAVLIELEAPGADIVGFEHPAESAEDRAAVEAAKAALSDPLSLFVPSAAAGCTVTATEVALIGDDHDDEEHGHDEHAEDDHDEHGEEHADAHGHDHGHDHKDEHAGHGHDDHGHDDHAEANHTEFHAEYTLTCADPDALQRVEFPYFETFPNAEELEVQMIGTGGSAGFEVTRDDPALEIPGNI
ncbi:MAG: DUF2796 domain-containing protein [Pseudomonadota bacterium]